MAPVVPMATLTFPLHRRAVLAVFALAAGGACGRRGDRSAARARCAYCGMRIPAGSHWEAGARGADGAPLAFDTPGCLFRLRLAPRGAGMHAEWVTEYYGPAGRHTEARAARYVLGSDVVGPMGRDLVPIDPARVETFRRDHRGRPALGFDEITARTLGEL